MLTIGINLLNKRAELMKSNEKFSQDICNILKEAAEEKMEIMHFFVFRNSIHTKCSEITLN